MTRMLPTLLALVTAGAALTIPAVAPAQADGGTYADLTTIAFTDAAGDAPAGVDLRLGQVTLDPNLPFLEASVTLGAGRAEPSFVVPRLGELVSGTCEHRVEVVSNRATGPGALVREPGVGQLPKDTPGRAEDRFEQKDPRLDLVPGCAVLDLVDKAGRVLDTAAGVVTHTAAGRAGLRIEHGREAILNVNGGQSDFPYEWFSASGPVYDARIDLVPGDPGLTVEDLSDGDSHVDLGNVRGRQGHGERYLDFTATPGMHTLTLRLSGGNAPTSEAVLTIWARGGPALAPRDSLAGRSFFTERSVYPETGAYFRAWRAFDFLDATWVRTSYRNTWPTSPAPYLPCIRVTQSCQRYSYDARTGAVQIGTDRGELRGRTLAFYSAHDRAQRARAGTTLAFLGRNLFLYDEDPDLGRAGYRLTLRKDGTFTRVSQVYDQEHPATQHGRYRIGAGGLLAARTATGTVLRTGLYFPLDAQGRPRPHKLGVYAFDVWFRPKAR